MQGVYLEIKAKKKGKSPAIGFPTGSRTKNLSTLKGR
jgi:hypothetical protein